MHIKEMIKPTKNNILLKSETKTKSGIILSETQESVSRNLIIERIGKDCDKCFKVGMKVYIDGGLKGINSGKDEIIYLINENNIVAYE